MNLLDYYLSTLGESIHATCVLWVQQKHTHAGMELSSSYTFSTLQTSLVLYTIKQRPPSLPVHQPMHPLPKVVQLSRAILNTWIHYGYLYTTSSLSTLHCIMSSSVYAPAIYNRVLVMDMKSSLGLVVIGRATEQDGNSGWMCERWSDQVVWTGRMQRAMHAWKFVVMNYTYRGSYLNGKLYFYIHWTCAMMSLLNCQFCFWQSQKLR